MPVYQLPDDEIVFPHPSMAEPNGLLAVGGDLSPEWLLLAYQNGIFPWFEEDGYFFWYSPDPRWVLFPEELKIHKSMRSVFNGRKFEYTLDTAFEEVMRQCAHRPREEYSGSWITDAFLENYIRMHELGLAHSVEVWLEEELVGGLYGIALGKIFFGESMFAKKSNASKAGFITLVKALAKNGFQLIDCQQQTAHLGSLGARGISREMFLAYLENNRYEKTLIGKWKLDDAEGIALQ